MPMFHVCERAGIRIIAAILHFIYFAWSMDFQWKEMNGHKKQ